MVVDPQRVVEVGSIFKVLYKLDSFLGYLLQFLAELILCDVGIDSDNQVRQTVHCYIVEMNLSDGLDDAQNE